MSDKISYHKQNSEYISKGSSRYVFKISPEVVIKIAYTEAGIEQNRVEYNDQIIGKLGTRSYDFGDGYKWITQEYVRKATEEDFLRLTGRDFQYTHDFVYAVRRSYISNIPLPIIFNFNPGSLFSELYDYLLRAKLNACIDYGKITSWGIRNEKELVIVDHGLSDEIYKKYYTK